MKKAAYLILIVLISFACASTKGLLKKGKYDTLVKKSVKKLRVEPDDEKYLDLLKQAYPMANQEDQDKVKYLKQSGQPDRWGGIFNAYTRLKDRQDLVRTLAPRVLNEIGFSYSDYDQDIITAKQNAAEYYYAHAKQLLESGNKYDAQQAYNEFAQVNNYFAGYKDTDALMSRAQDMGTNHVLYRMINKTGVPFPPNFEAELEKISLKSLNQKFLNFDIKPVNNRVYDYLINVNTNRIDVSPELVEKTNYSNSKEVEDGWQYVLDGNGNVMKDSLGNDITVTVYKTITCHVTEVHLKKSCVINGSIDFVRDYTGELLSTTPFTANTLFEHVYATAVGDLEASTPQVRELIHREPLPFPRSDIMVLETADKMKGVLKDMIKSKRNLFK